MSNPAVAKLIKIKLVCGPGVFTSCIQLFLTFHSILFLYLVFSIRIDFQPVFDTYRNICCTQKVRIQCTTSISYWTQWYKNKTRVTAESIALKHSPNMFWSTAYLNDWLYVFQIYITFSYYGNMTSFRQIMLLIQSLLSCAARNLLNSSKTQ